MDEVKRLREEILRGMILQDISPIELDEKMTKLRKLAYYEGFKDGIKK